MDADGVECLRSLFPLKLLDFFDMLTTLGGATDATDIPPPVAILADDDAGADAADTVVTAFVTTVAPDMNGSAAAIAKDCAPPMPLRDERMSSDVKLFGTQPKGPVKPLDNACDRIIVLRDERMWGGIF